VSPGSEKQSAAAAAGERVRAVLEAAEQSARELRAEAAQEIEAQLETARGVAERLSTRADEIERTLQGLADSVRDELSALKADLEELRAVGEGIGESREVAEEPAAEAPAPLEEPAPVEESAPLEEPAAEEPTRVREPAPVEEPAPEEEPANAEPAAAGAEPAAAPGDGHEGARVIALNMALNGSSREDTARYLSENFELEDPEALLDEVYARVER
jgi:hypothetical protein